MKKLTFNNIGRKIDREDLNILEKKYQITFPECLKLHYLQYNGGYPSRDILISGEEEYKINYFLKVGEGNNSFEKIYDLLQDEKIFPKWLIPFADDEGGNYFCISIADSDYGSIYYYNHEFEYEENPENYICIISDSWSSFLESLQESSIDDDSNLNKNSGFVFTEDWLNQISNAKKKK